MKDELCGKVMTEFVALRAKLYAYKQLDIKKPEDKRCKGIKKCVVKKMLTFDDYKKCLDDGENVCREQILFQNKDYEVCTNKANKIALNRNNNKTLVQVNQISTLARGHHAARAELKILLVQNAIHHYFEGLLPTIKDGLYRLYTSRGKRL